CSSDLPERRRAAERGIAWAQAPRDQYSGFEALTRDRERRRHADASAGRCSTRVEAHRASAILQGLFRGSRRFPRAMRWRGAAGLAGVMVALVVALGAQEPVLWPGTTYDPAIPTSRAILGHDFGEEISSPEQIARYLRALADAAPDRTRLVEYARTWEDRPLHLLIIGAPERIAR